MKEDVSYSAVMYTDGSCMPPRGQHGGGCHGYLYGQEDFKKNLDRPSGYTVTDYGYLDKDELNYLNRIKEASGLQPKELKPSLYYNAAYAMGCVGTNNRAELLAVIKTIKIISNEYNISDILICTDSMYVISVHDLVVDDAKRLWRGTNKPNLDLIELLADTLKEYSGIKITLNKVTAHATDVGNNIADRLAYVGRVMAVSDAEIEHYKFYTGKYWKDKPTPNPLLNFKQVYFNVGFMPDVNEHIYVIMDYPKDVELGNKSAEPIFGITIFDQGVDEIDRVCKQYHELRRGYHFLTTLDLRVLYSQNHSKMFELLGDNIYNTNKGRLMVLDDSVLTTPISPPGLAQNAISKTLDLYKIYKKFRHGGIEDVLCTCIDVTDQFYDKNDKGKTIFKYKTDVVGPHLELTLDEFDVKMDCVYGVDTLTRNQLKKIETKSPRIHMVFYKRGDGTYEYHNIIETSDGCGIYGNFYVNKLYLGA